MKSVSKFGCSTLALAFALALPSRPSLANSISTSVAGTYGLASPLATGFVLPADVTYTAAASGSVDLLAGGDYPGCTGAPYGCSYSVDPTGTILFNNSQGIAFDGNPGDSNIVSGVSDGSALNGAPYGALIAEFVPIDPGSPTFVELGAGGTFTAPAFDSQVSFFVNDTNLGDNTGSFSVTLDYVPEPISTGIFGVALAGLAAARRRRA